MKKIVGLCITSISMLVLSVILMLGKISMHIDELTKDYHPKLLKNIPNVIFVLIALSIGIGVYLFMEDE